MRFSNIWRGNHVCVCITGSSRGLGKQIAIGFAKHFNDCHKCELCCNDFSLSFVLISRDVWALQELSKEISSIDCHIRIVDIIGGSLDDNITIASFERTCQKIASNHIYDQIIIVHNAGSLGDVNLLTNQLDINSKEMLNSYFELNLFSVMQMTGIFLKLFAYIKHKTIINITSLAALTPFKGLSLYCIGKASRDAFFRSVALENESVQVLNYAPGPLETDMVSILRNHGHLREDFQRMEVMKPETTVAKLISILEENKFRSGDHVDFYTPFSP